MVRTVKSLNIYNGRLFIHLKAKHPDLLSEIILRTQFLDRDINPKKSISIHARIYCLEHNITTSPKCQCPGCNNSVSWRNGKNEFGKHCSCKCSMNDPENQRLHKETNLKRFGVENPFQSDDIKNKIRETNLKIRGVEHPMQDAQVRNKVKQSCLAKYGVTHPLKSDTIKSVINKTCMKKYGTKWTCQSEIVKARIKKSNIEKYGVENFA